MLLERNQAIVGLIFSVLLVVGTVVGILFDRSWITGGATINAYFADAAGLGAGDTVLIAGVRAGAVESVELADGAVKTVLRVEEPMPRDSRARIVLQNFLGKRAVQIEAGDEWGELLADGDEIPLDRTSGPTDFAEFYDTSTRMLQQTDVDALATLVSSVADVTEGQREEVAELLDGLQRITRVIADRRVELGQVLDRSEDVFRILAEEDDDLTTIIDEFGATLDMLARRREDVSRLLRETARSSNLAADLVTQDRAQLDRSLRELHEALEVVDAHQVDLAHVFAYGPVAFEGYQNIAKSGEADNPYWGNVFTQSLGGIGVDPLLGCGGVVDDLLDQVLGPDPRTCEEQDVEGDGGGGGGDGGTPAPPAPSLRGLFATGLPTTAAGDGGTTMTSLRTTGGVVP